MKPVLIILDNAEDIEYIQLYLVNIYKNTYFIITTRDEGFKSKYEVKDILLTPFDRDEAKEFLDRSLNKTTHNENEILELLENELKYGVALPYKLKHLTVYLDEHSHEIKNNDQQLRLQSLNDIEFEKRTNRKHKS